MSVYGSNRVVLRDRKRELWGVVIEFKLIHFFVIKLIQRSKVTCQPYIGITEKGSVPIGSLSIMSSEVFDLF